MIKILIAAWASAALSTYFVLSLLLTFGDVTTSPSSGIPWNIVLLAIAIFLSIAFAVAVTTRVLIREINSSPDAKLLQIVLKREERRQIARLKFFDPIREFGFATLEDGRDVFIHKSRFRNITDVSLLQTGATISMHLVEKERGLVGTNIQYEEP